jgi:glycosyltransferase involved in cell wall biosynthesis
MIPAGTTQTTGAGLRVPEVANPGPGVSVAVCTRHRPVALRRALGSICAQSAAPCEILVVDNAPDSPATADVVREGFPEVTYLVEPRPGLDVARNRALRSAGGEVVAFLDDDAVAHEAWLTSLAGAFADGAGVAACTGRVLAWEPETEAQFLFEANGGFDRGTERIRLPSDSRRRLHGLPAPLIAWAMSIGGGCNLAVRRSAALAVGGFDEALDRGPPLPGGGDLDMIWRLLEAGGEVVYEPRALAWHEHRRELPAVFDQIVGHQKAVSAFLAKSLRCAHGSRRVELGAYLAWRLVKPGARLLRRMARRDPLPSRVLLRMWWEAWRGLMAYSPPPRATSE